VVVASQPGSAAGSRILSSWSTPPGRMFMQHRTQG